jgi:hypothetical protein
LKHDLAIVSTDKGTRKKRSDEQLANADSPRLEIFEPRSNAKSERFAHPSKLWLGIIPSDKGTQIDRSNKQLPNEPGPRVESLQPASNLTVERFVQS